MKRIVLFIGLLVGCVVTTFADGDLCTDGVLLFREDFGGNDPNDPMFYEGEAPGMSSRYHNCNGGTGTSCYAITKKGIENGIQWHRQDDHTYPNDFSRGYFLEVDGIGGNDYFYNTTIDNLCPGVELTFSAYVVNVTYAGQVPYLKANYNYVYPRMKFVLKDPNTGEELASKSTGDIQPDPRYETSDAWKYARENELSAEWQLVGVNFTVPDGVTSVQMYIYNDAPSGTGNDFALDDIEVHLCIPPVHIEGEHEWCTERSATLTANMEYTPSTNELMYCQWWFSTDGKEFWRIPGATGYTLTKNAVNTNDEGWYCVTLATETENHGNPKCRATSEPFSVITKECCPVVPEHRKEIVVCDSLLPYTWNVFGESIRFDAPGTQVFGPKMDNRPECYSEKYIVTLDTIHCEHLYPLIVNKYNWQLLCNNVELRRFFPEQQAKEYQWYRVQGEEAEPIEGATADNYAEQQELHGAYQLRVTMDDGDYVWSQVLQIDESQGEQPVSVRIYNSRGMQVSEDQMKHGIFLLIFQQGKHVWTEKRLIP